MHARNPSSDQNASNLFPNGDRPIHAFFWWCVVPEKGKENVARFCCAQHRRELWIRPIVCFQIHFEFLSPKLERKKLQIEFLLALPCPARSSPPPPTPLPPSCRNFVFKARVNIVGVKGGCHELTAISLVCLGEALPCRQRNLTCTPPAVSHVSRPACFPPLSSMISFSPPWPRTLIEVGSSS